MTERIGQRFGNYRLTRLLGNGGFGSVYLAEHIYLHTSAAIKILTAQLSSPETEQFRREAYILARFNHPNIIRMLDFGLEEKNLLPFLIMQYAPHGTLRQRHPEGSRIPLNAAQLYVKSIAAALQYAHDHHIIHRDVKPENMLIGEQDEILLGDFGLALLSQNTLNSLQQSQDMGGTAYYMAPEQLDGKARPASDQYALAVVVYEWLCGTRPFEGSPIEVCLQHMTAQPQPLREKLPTLSPAVEQVVMKALEKDPKQRFDSVQAFATAFAEAVEGKATASNSGMQALATVIEEAVEEATSASNSENIPVAAPAEHMEEQEKALAGHQQSYIHDQDQGHNVEVQEQAIASHQSGSPQSGSSHSSSPSQNVLTPTKPAFVRRQTRKPRALVLGIVALILLILVGSSIAGVFILMPHAHTPVITNAPSATPTHTPAAKATATSTTTAHTPTATAAPTTPAQQPTAPVIVHVTSSINFTTQPPTQDGMVIDTNASQATFQADPNHVNLGSIVVDFTLQPQANTATLSITGLVSQAGANNTGTSPINISCNNQVIASNFVKPGNWANGISPDTATFSLSGCLTQGSNVLQITTPNAITNFWLYNLSVTQSS